MKLTKITVGLLMLMSVVLLPAQAGTPKAKGFLGKQLPPMRGDTAKESPWLGGKKPKASLPVRGELSLVVLTSLA